MKEPLAASSLSRPPVGQASGPPARSDVRTAGSRVAQVPRLLDRVRATVKALHYSPRTEEAYVGWIRRFILFHGRRHPDEMAEAEITAFLSNLATESRVAASTQNQALAGVRSPLDR
jgi:hypothetical protein